MNALIYKIMLLAGLGIFIYFYIFNFDSMSETELMNNVLYWYVPLIFGVFGLAAIRLHKAMGRGSNPISFLFSGKDKVVTIWAIIMLVATGIVGALLLFVPLAIIKPNTKSYDVYIAIIGTLIWMAALWLFFVALWPSL